MGRRDGRRALEPSCSEAERACNPRFDPPATALGRHSRGSGSSELTTTVPHVGAPSPRRRSSGTTRTTAAQARHDAEVDTEATRRIRLLHQARAHDPDLPEARALQLAALAPRAAGARPRPTGTTVLPPPDHEMRACAPRNAGSTPHSSKASGAVTRCVTEPAGRRGPAAPLRGARPPAGVRGSIGSSARLHCTRSRCREGAGCSPSTARWLPRRGLPDRP